MSIFLNAKAVAPKRDGFSGSAKSLAEFAPAGANKVLIIFSGGVYVGENQPSTGRKPMFSCLSMANSARKRASASECAAVSRSFFK